MAKNWEVMDHAEKLEALGKDMGETAAFVNRMAADIRELNARLNEAKEEIRSLRNAKA